MRRTSHGSALRSLVGRLGAGGQGRHCERGQTLVIAALLMIVLVGALALVVDVGHAYTQRRLVQNAADAAALAGVRALALDKTAAIDAAVNEYAVQRNPGQSYEMAVVDRSGAVTVTKTFSTYFASVIGTPAMTVVATAEGVYEFTKVMGGLAPLAVHKDAFLRNDGGDLVQIWDSSKYPSAAGIIAGGERGWLNFANNDGGANSLESWIINGYGGDVYTAQACEDMGSTDSNCGWILGIPGTKNVGEEPLRTTYAPYEVTQRMLLVPLYDTVRPTEYVVTDPEEKIDYHIVGFAAFEVESVVSEKGSDEYPATVRKVKGRFSHYVAMGDIGGEFDTGVRVIGLRR